MDLTKRLGGVVVLDLEARPDPEGHRVAHQRGGSIVKGLSIIRNVSLLFAREDERGRFSDLDLRTVRNEDEFDLLMELDRLGSDLADQAHFLLTFNGLAHDLSVIRRRASANWMFALPGLNRLLDMPHIDLFQRAGGLRGERLSLRHLCAAYRIPTDHLTPLRGEDDDSDPGERKSEVDVVATFIAFLFDVASARRSDEALVEGWSALRDYILRDHQRSPHLMQFTASRELLARVTERHNLIVSE